MNRRHRVIAASGSASVAAPPSGYSFTNSEASDLVARMTSEPDDTRKGHIDTLVGSLKTAGVWTQLDALWVMAAHNEQAAQRNWVADTYNLGIGEQPTFAADDGYTGNGSSQYLTTSTVLNALANYTQNDCHLGSWTLTAGTAGKYSIGNSATNVAGVQQNAGATERGARINAASTLTTNDNVTTGHVVGVRTAADAIQSYRNGGTQTTGTTASGALTAQSFYLLRTVGTYSDQQIAVAHIGASLADTEVAAMYTALSTYLTAVGAI